MNSLTQADDVYRQMYNTTNTVQRSRGYKSKRAPWMSCFCYLRTWVRTRCIVAGRNVVERYPDGSVKVAWYSTPEAVARDFGVSHGWGSSPLGEIYRAMSRAYKAADLTMRAYGNAAVRIPDEEPHE
jgi:hypothetical protein